MPLDWKSGPLADGLACYRRGAFFEAHEHWEAVWVNAAEPERTFLQALIHITVALHHEQCGNSTGATRQLSRALRKLGPYPAEFCEVQIEPLRANIAAWLAALQSGSPAGLPPPPIL